MATQGQVFEKRWPQNAELFTANGTIDGKITVSSTVGFFVGQKVQILSVNPSVERLSLQIKAVTSSTELFVGPDTNSLTKDSKDRGRSIYARTDLTSFTVADSAQVFANEQDRPAFGSEVVIRAVYQEEPAVALRVLSVDKFGNPVGGSGGVSSDVNVFQWGGSTTSLGQKTMAQSVPVVLPSDQSLTTTSETFVKIEVSYDSNDNPINVKKYRGTLATPVLAIEQDISYDSNDNPILVERQVP